MIHLATPTLSRLLTPAERTLATGIFGSTIDYARVHIHRRRWWPFQPKDVTMAPDGDLWFHPRAPHYRDCFASAERHLQAHFIHELTHVWQAQRGGRWHLPLMRHPFCRYDYEFEPGKPFSRYGIEQQATIAEHLFLRRCGAGTSGMASREELEAICRF